MNYVFGFLVGLFLTNGIPHLVKGITGQSHMTPFHRVSSPLINVTWAFVNFAIGLALFSFSGASFNDVTALDSFGLAFVIGAFCMALSCAWLFSNPNARFPWQKD